MGENNKLETSKYWIQTDENNFKNKVQELVSKKANFIAYLYGAHDSNGHSWCPDCVVAQPYVKNVLPTIFKNEKEHEVYFVDVPIKVNKRDVYRNDKTLKMRRVPTLIYFKNGREMGRAVEGEMMTQEEVTAFIDIIYEE